MSVASDGKVVRAGDIATQTDQVFRNMQELLRAAGTDMPDLMKLHTLTDTGATILAARLQIIGRI